MHMRAPSVLYLSLPLTMALSTSACGDSGVVGEDETAGSETATDTGTGDEVGDDMGDGDGDTTGDGDGDGDTTDTGCPIGAEGCPCTPGGGCDPGLMCESGVCVPEAGTTGDGDGDTTGDGDGDTPGDGDGDTTGDGDGDPTGDGDGDTTTGGLCDMDVYIELDADDAADSPGWSNEMSQIAPEEGDILVIESPDNNNITWEVDVPCEDTYHVWVRGWEQGNDDSFFAQTDGQPDPGLIFELDCTQGPNQSHYLWKELNQRELDAGPCEYVNDPWTQDWTAGVHTVSLQFRESQAVSAIVVTNTPDPPPEP